MFFLSMCLLDVSLLKQTNFGPFIIMHVHVLYCVLVHVYSFLSRQGLISDDSNAELTEEQRVEKKRYIHIILYIPFIALLIIV